MESIYQDLENYERRCEEVDEVLSQEKKCCYNCDADIDDDSYKEVEFNIDDVRYFCDENCEKSYYIEFENSIEERLIMMNKRYLENLNR